MLKTGRIIYPLFIVWLMVISVHGQEQEVISGSACGSGRPLINYDDGIKLSVFNSLQAYQIPLLKGNHTEIYLDCVCEEIHIEGHKCPKFKGIPFSPQILSPNVVKLSLMSCLLTDEDIYHLNEFTNLKILNLESNFVTDASIPMIA